MKKIATVTILTLAVAVGILVAQQTAPTPPSAEQRVQHHIQFLTDALSLTSSQQAQATTIFTAAATSEDGQRAAMKSAHDALQAAIKANDSAAIDAAAKNIANLMAQFISTQAKAQAAFYQILTPEQQSKRGALGGPGMHGMGRGPGGPGGFGPPRGGPQE